MMRIRGLICTLLIAICLGGCISPTADTTEPVTFSVLYNNREATPFSTDWLIIEEYKNRQNVLLDVQLGDDADYEKDVTVALESGDPPDIILKVWPAPIESYANAGVLLPFSDYEDQMPHFMAYINEHDLQDELDKLRLDNGKYYILPGYQRESQVQQWIYRRDLFEAHDLAMPTTYDELFDSLVRLKELYPDSTPLSTLWGGAHLFAMMGAGYDIPAGWNGTRYYNATEDRWQFAPATGNYRAMLTFLNRCYEAGVLDPEMFTQSDEEFYAKLQDGRAFVTVTWISSGFANWNAALHENGFPDAEWAPLPVPESSIGIKALPAVDPFRKGLIVPARVVDEPYFAALLQFLDWAVYSEEGRTLTTWGVEGVTFQNGPNGKNFLPDISPEEHGLNLLFNLTEEAEYADLNKPAEITAFLDRSLHAEETLPLSPQLQLDAQSIETVRIINEKLDPYVVEMQTKFIIGELDIAADWDDYVSELESRGYTTLEIIWNDAWQQ